MFATFFTVAQNRTIRVRGGPEKIPLVRRFRCLHRL